MRTNTDIETVAHEVGMLPAEVEVFYSHSGAIVHGRGEPLLTVLLSIASNESSGLRCGASDALA